MSEDSFDPMATGRITGKRQAKVTGEPVVKPREEAEPSSVNGIAVGQMRAIVERIERLEEEKKSIADDIKDVYGEAKGQGFDTKVLRQIIRLRKQDANERREQEEILELYKHALGMAEEPLIPRDPSERAAQALAAADEKIKRRRARKED